jgi:putative peptidoglycan lipid II flippase
MLARLSGVYAGSRVLGLAREITMAVLLGTSAAADRVNVVFVVSSVATIVVGESVYASCVRSLGSAFHTDRWLADYAALLRSVRRVAAVAAALYVAIAPPLSLLILGDGGGSARETVTLSLLLTPAIAAYSILACVNARLTLERRFVLMNSVQVLFSLGSVMAALGACAAFPDLAAEALVAGWSLGNVTAVLILLRRAGPLTKPGKHAISASRAVRYGLPVAGAYALIAVQALTDRAVASRLETGAAAALGYGDRLFLVPVGFVLAAVGPLVLGSLTHAARTGSRGVSEAARDQLSLLSAAALPIGILFTGAGPLLVAHLLGYGAFDRSSVDITIEALDGLSFGLAVTSVNLGLVRVMQATGHVKALMAFAGLGALFNLLLSVAGAASLGVLGITLATSATAVLMVFGQLGYLQRQLGADWASRIRRTVALHLTAGTIATGLLVIGFHQGWFGEVGRLALAAVLAAVTARLVVRARQAG